MTEKGKIYYTSKYGLTSGIEKVETKSDSENMILVEQEGRFASYYHRGEFHETLAEAKAKVEKMRQRKVAALKKQLAKMEAFKPKEPRHD